MLFNCMERTDSTQFVRLNIVYYDYIVNLPLYGSKITTFL